MLFWHHGIYVWLLFSVVCYCGSSWYLAQMCQSGWSCISSCTEGVSSFMLQVRHLFHIFSLCWVFGLFCLQVFRSLYENASKSTFVTWLLATLVAVRDVCKLVAKELTSWVCFSAVAFSFYSTVVTSSSLQRSDSVVFSSILLVLSIFLLLCNSGNFLSALYISIQWQKTLK